MDTNKLLELAFYTLPALITGGVAYYLFQSYFADQQHTRRWLIQRDNQKTALPIRLQAYERLALFLERIHPNKLLIRIAPFSDDKVAYQSLLINTIEQEFEHNLAQQIYVSGDCWTLITTAKNTIIQNIRQTTADTTIADSSKLREKILSDLLESQAASTVALGFLKDEVKSFL